MKVFVAGGGVRAVGCCAECRAWLSDWYPSLSKFLCKDHARQELMPEYYPKDT